MKIGITERGDASLDYSWVNKLLDNYVDGSVIITKNIDEYFITNIMSLHRLGRKVIVHCTCTGYGSSILEPRVPVYYKQLDNLSKLINSGFPMSNCVLRVDPIIPNEKGIELSCKVIETVINTYKGMRVRISVLDEYKHVKERFRKLGIDNNYEGFQPVDESLINLINKLSEYDTDYEVCAENRLVELALQNGFNRFIKRGCISNEDLRILGIDCDSQSINPQNRHGCLCLSCKTELLSNRHRCYHGCAYCYWKD